MANFASEIVVFVAAQAIELMIVNHAHSGDICGEQRFKRFDVAQIMHIKNVGSELTNRGDDIRSGGCWI